MKRMRKVVSLAVCMAMLLGMLPVDAYAAEQPEYLAETDGITDSLNDGDFYFGSQNAEIPENAGHGYLLKVGRKNGGDAAQVRLTVTDYNAKINDDYTFDVYRSNETVENEKVSQSVYEQITENKESLDVTDTSDEIINGTYSASEDTEIGEEEQAALEDSAQSAVKEYFGVQESEAEASAESESSAEPAASDQITESGRQETSDVQEPESKTESKAEDSEEKSETAEPEASESAADGKAEISEEAPLDGKQETVEKSEDDGSRTANLSIAQARSALTGLEDDRQPMDSSDSGVMEQLLGQLENQDIYGEVIPQINDALNSPYVILEFAEGETEKYIEIAPKDNSKSDGDRMFTVTMTAESDNAVISNFSGFNAAIRDDEEAEESVVSFTEQTYYPEGGYIQVTVSRSGGLNQVAAVNMTTSDGTAVNGRDYSKVDTTVAFAYGMEERTINIPVRSEAIRDTADFSIHLSEPVNCTIGNGDANGVIAAGDESFVVMSEDSAAEEDAPFATQASYANGVRVGDPIDLKPAANSWQSSSSYGRYANGVYEMYTDNAAFSGKKTTNRATWMLDGGGYELGWGYNGVAIDWKKTSGKPCYTTTSVMLESTDNYEDNTERWGQQVSLIYEKSYKQIKLVSIKDTRDMGMWGKSPTLTIYGIQPILRPFEVSLVQPDPLTYYDEKGNLVSSSSIAELRSSSETRLDNQNANNISVRYQDDYITVSLSHPDNSIVRMKGIEVVRTENGKVVSSWEVPNQQISSTYVQFKLTKEMLRELSQKGLITYTKWNNQGYKGQFSVRPVLEYKDTKVTVDNSDVRGYVLPDHAKDVPSVTNGTSTTYTFHQGDFITLRQYINDSYKAAYRQSSINIHPSNSLGGAMDFNVDDNGVGTRYTAGSVNAAPNFDRKGNQLVVQVKTADIDRFYDKLGIFEQKGTVNGEYTEYVLMNNTDFTTGRYVKLTAYPKDEAYVPVWQSMSSTDRYSQSTYTALTDDDIEKNVYTLTLEAADQKLYNINGTVYYSDAALGETEGSTTLRAASDVIVQSDELRFGVSDENGGFTIPSISGVSGCRVQYRICSNTEESYRSILLNQENEQDGAYQIPLDHIVISTKNTSVPYASSFVAMSTDGTQLANNTVAMDDAPKMLMAFIANDGAEYTDTSGAQKKETVTNVDFVVYDFLGTNEKSVIPAAKISSASGYDIWSATRTFERGDQTITPGDKIYIRITTDRVVGLGGHYDESTGEFVKNDAFQQTVYTPVNTGYRFYEQDYVPPVTQDLNFEPEDMNLTLPVIGKMNLNLTAMGMHFAISPLPDGGMRFSIGKVIKNIGLATSVDENGKIMTDTQQKYSILHPSSIKNIGEDLKKIMGKDGTQSPFKNSVGIPKLTFSPYVGVYLDFGKRYVANDKHGYVVKTVFTGGGGYFGMNLTAKYTLYFVLGAVPVYVGGAGVLNTLMELGVVTSSENELTYDQLMQQNGISENSFDAVFRGKASLSLYAGVGLCGVVGVRGGIEFAPTFAWSPMIQKEHPEYHQTGWILNFRAKFWADLLLFTVPYTFKEFVNEKYGYFADIENQDYGVDTQLLTADTGSTEPFIKERGASSAWVSREALSETMKPERL